MVSLSSDNSDPPTPQNDGLNSSSEVNALKSELNLSFENDEAAVQNVSTEKITSNNIQSNGGEKYIASLDVGTTLVRCYIFNKKGGIVAQTEDKINLLYPKPRCVEMDPEEVWEKSHSVISRAIQKVGAENIISLGICTQRCTFLTWNSKTGAALHNLITWKDVRADVLVKEWNSSLLMKFLRTSCSLLYFVSNYKRFQAVSVLKFFNAQVILRLKWVLTNNAEVRKLISENSVRFGTLDTWLINKLTGGKVFATDFSNASATAMFDPYLNQWSSFVTGLIGIPKDILPELRTSAGDWGHCCQDLFGREISITGVVSDQGASLAGGGGFLKGHVKITLGTGGFLNLNTGDKPHSSVDGIYPVVGWQTPDGKVVYMAEGAANNVGTVVEWGKKKIQNLKKDFPNMRRTRPDGNCFLRGFIYAYLEHCIQNKTEMERFKALIVSSKDKLIKLGFPAFTTEDFHNMFVEVLTDIEATPTNECLHKNLNDSGISDYIVVYLRLLISAHLQENAEFFTFFIEGGRTVEEFRKQEVEPMYRECDHLHIVALTSALSVPVCVMYLDRGEQDKAATHTFPEETSEAVLHLLYRPGHYDIIYKK